MSDNFDLTDDFDRLTGNTLSDDWDANPDPPEEYGRVDPDLILEFTAGIVWVWSSSATEEHLEYFGEPADIEY